MTELTAQTTFNIIAAPEVFMEFEDLYLHPENAGSGALRELRYPGDVLPPFVCETNPDRWDNFDSVPWTPRPLVSAQKTLSSAQVVRWPGYLPDNPVREIWRGQDTVSRMTAYMLRRLYEYYMNPPLSGYITWHPKDRTETAYLVQIEGLTVGGQDAVTFDFLALRHELIPLEVVLKLRIIREAR
jgi:hypothetical protein